MTAAKLLDAFIVAGCAPALDGPDVVFDTDPPPGLDRDLDVLLTGVRALLMGKRWYRIDCATGRTVGPYPLRTHGPLAFGCLDPAAKLPRNVGLLTIENGKAERWDRLPPFAVDDLPDCFDPQP